MKRLAFATALLIALVGSVHAQFKGGGGFGTPGFTSTIASGGGGGGCSQATTFLARNGNANAAATTTLICGLVTDGIITGTLSGANACGSVLDTFYIIATDTAAHAALNICGTNFGLAAAGTMTFTANVGYAGDGSTGFLNTTFAPSANGINFTQNSASMGAYIQTSRTAGNTSVIAGAQNNADTAALFMQPLTTTPSFVGDVNATNFPAPTNLNTRGAWIFSRVSASTLSLYQNGSTTLFSLSTGQTSLDVPNQPVSIGAYNNIGGPSFFSTDQISAFFLGGGLTSAQAFAINNRINAYMAALGVNVY